MLCPIILALAAKAADRKPEISAACRAGECRWFVDGNCAIPIIALRLTSLDVHLEHISGEFATGVQIVTP